jgi:hypothetical protein
VAGPLLAEVAEKEATGAVAEIYQDLRFSLRVPMVNLIFRHLATVPGCLEWFWSSVGPYYVSGELTAAAAELVAARPIPRMTLPFADCGLDQGALRTVLMTCDAYARANPANLLALSIAKLYLDAMGTVAGDTQAAYDSVPRAAATPLDALPAMAAIEQLTSELQTLLRMLATQVHGEDGPVVPSFYRHFTAWPTFLRTLYAHLPEILPRINTEVPAFERDAMDLAKALYAKRAKQPLHRPSAPNVAAFRAVLTYFPANLCRMTLLPLAIKNALGSQLR